jgi:carbon storage regulator
MLVLSRQRDETIMIGDDIEITVVDIRGDKVRLGITAPSHVPVHRKEVYEAIKRENRAATKMKPEDLPPQAPPQNDVKNGDDPSNRRPGQA